VRAAVEPPGWTIRSATCGPKVAAQPVLPLTRYWYPGAACSRPAQATVPSGVSGAVGPPTHRTAEKLPSMAVWAVPGGRGATASCGDRSSWMLLTTCAVHTPAARLSRLDWYACRWGIEVWHKCSRAAVALKPGIGDAARLAALVCPYSVIGLALLYPPCDRACLTPVYRLWNWRNGRRSNCAIHVPATPPATPASLRQACIGFGRLAGFPGPRG